MIITMERIREPAGRKPPRRPAKGRAGLAVPLSFGRGLRWGWDWWRSSLRCSWCPDSVYTSDAAKQVPKEVGGTALDFGYPRPVVAAVAGPA